jgi:beta-lactamase superfamily II metal-dependent hydrolase
MAGFDPWDRDLLTDDKLAIFMLNVGHGDSLIVRFPIVNGEVTCGLIDCFMGEKVEQALADLGTNKIAFMCATHPHFDHISGFKRIIKWARDEQNIPVAQFWDNGFRHVSGTHYSLIRCLQEHPEISFLRVTSGFEVTVNGVRVLVLAPSIRLKNRYDTFGTNINNSSIVLKLEYPAKDVAQYYAKPKVIGDEELAEEEKLKQSTAILAGDAQFESWAHAVQEFPQLSRSKVLNRGRLIRNVTHKPFHCQLIKIPHHMSKNGISYEILYHMNPKMALVSSSDTHKHKCPHQLTVDATEELDGCEIAYTGNLDPALRSGSVAALLDKSGSKPKVFEMCETKEENAPI